MVSATGFIHHRRGQRGRLDQSEETKWGGRLRPHVVRGHHPGEKQQRCCHLHLKSCSHSSVILSTIPLPSLHLSTKETAPEHLHEHFTCPSLNSISVLLFVPLPSLCCHIYGTHRWVCEHEDRMKLTVRVRASHLACRHGYHFTIKVFNIV